MLKKHEINIHTEEEALQQLHNESLSLQEREEAIEYLRNEPTPTAMEQLIAALEDPEFGIRWSAGTALAQLGDAALAPMLKALTRPSISLWLREGAQHVFQYSRSARVQRETAELRAVLLGMAADVSTMYLAWKILNELNNEDSGQSQHAAEARVSA